jgi:hypothetical protein
MVIQQDAADAFSDLKQTQRIVLVLHSDWRPWHYRSEPDCLESPCEPHLASGYGKRPGRQEERR